MLQSLPPQIRLLTWDFRGPTVVANVSLSALTSSEQRKVRRQGRSLHPQEGRGRQQGRETPVQRPAPLLIAESACKRSARVGFSRGKDAWAPLPLPLTVKAKLFQNPHLSRSRSTPLTEPCCVAATQTEKARPRLWRESVSSRCFSITPSSASRDVLTWLRPKFLCW